MPSIIENKRNQSIEIARVIAAFLIVIYHTYLRTDFEKSAVSLQYIIPPISFFFFFAAYFSPTNLKIIFKRFFQLLILLIFWESVTVILAMALNWEYYLSSQFFQLVENDFKLFLSSIPRNPYLWFIRELLLFSLLIPIFMRCKVLLFPAALLILFAGELHLYPEHIWGKSLAYTIPSLAYFLLGLAFKDIPLKLFTDFFSKYSIHILLTALVFSLLLQVMYTTRCPYLFLEYRNHPMIGLMAIPILGALACFIDRHFQSFARFLAKVAPCCFLIYASQYAVAQLYDLLRLNLVDFLPEPTPVLRVIFTPFLVLLLSLLIKKTLKRFAPSCLPYIAGIKA